jgi:hypothetical protein
MSMKIERSSLELAFKDLRNVYRRLSDAEWRAKAMEKPAELVQNAARKNQQNAKAVHYWYTGQNPGRRRRRNSALSERIRVKPGNLRLSIQYLRRFRKKTPFAIVGPNIKPSLLDRKGSPRLKNLGRGERNTSGHYAWMAQKAYSGAEDFRQTVMEPALQQSTPAILSMIRRETDKRIEQIKNQLSVFR